jgi:ribosomal protein S12 methylthiotransferase
VTLVNDVEGDAPRSGEIRRLHVTGAHDYDLVGTLLAATEPLAGEPAAPALVQLAL